jgi:predicted amino acid racemase/uncharacterized NAD-dependent epimerase/dehydratase family protein
MRKTALIYCEGNFTKMDGKTANGLIRSSRKYQIVGVIDSTKTGMDSGEVLDGVTNGIPLFSSLDHALEKMTKVPNQFIYGIAPSGGFLKKNERNIVLQAMKYGMNIINPLHEFFTDDEEFMNYSIQCGVEIIDIRKPPMKKDMHLFSGRILNIKTPIVAVLGTDSAVGKRTTSVMLEAALLEKGLNVAFVATGQTGLIQGAKYGAAIDAIPSQFMTGEIENEVMKAYDNEKPDIIIVEGQGALSHPAYISSCAIIRGTRSGAIIVQHPPKRKNLGDFDFMKMPTIESEIELIQNFSKSKVIAVTINHENMSAKEIRDVITEYENQLELPTTDVLKYGCDKLVTSIFEAFPLLKDKENKFVAPRIEIDLTKIAHNAEVLLKLYGSKGIEIMGVTKGMCGEPAFAKILINKGIHILADSKIKNLKKMREAEIKAEFVLLRTPAFSEIEAVVKYADISLNTELAVIKSLSAVAKKNNTFHKIILMLELGDLREGIMPENLEEFIQEVLKLSGVKIVGIGANFACFGGVKPTEENMGKLSSLAIEIENKFSLSLSYISGGNSASYSWFMATESIGKVNNLRVGESILLGRETLYRRKIPGLYTDAFKFFAEVIESKIKPSVPYGEIAQNSLGILPKYQERGKIRRAILGVGFQDVLVSGITPKLDIEILGSSSDHIVVDAKKIDLQVGDEIEFSLNYGAILSVMTSPNVCKKYI